MVNNPQSNKAAPGPRLLTDIELEALPPPEWLIENILPKGGLAVLYAPPGRGKSFLALDWALSAGTGQPWLGMSLIKGLAVFVAAEGFGGLGSRVKAWKHHRGFVGKKANCYFHGSAINLLDHKEVDKFLFMLEAIPEPPILFIFDTMARCMIGDENSVGDVMKLIAPVDRIRHGTGATALVIHHTVKKDGGNKGPSERGSSALRGAADTMLYLKVDLGLLSLVCNKQKDAAQFSNIKFGLKVIELPGGASSCVITETAEAVMGSPSDPSKPVVQNPNYRKALEVLAKNFPSDGATATQWMKETGLVEKTFYRARENLERLGLVEKSGEGQGARYGLTDTGRKVLSLSPNCHSAVATVP